MLSHCCWATTNFNAVGRLLQTIHVITYKYIDIGECRAVHTRSKRLSRRRIPESHSHWSAHIVTVYTYTCAYARTRGHAIEVYIHKPVSIKTMYDFRSIGQYVFRYRSTKTQQLRPNWWCHKLAIFTQFIHTAYWKRIKNGLIMIVNDCGLMISYDCDVYFVQSSGRWMSDTQRHTVTIPFDPRLKIFSIGLKANASCNLLCINQSEILKIYEDPCNVIKETVI